MRKKYKYIMSENLPESVENFIGYLRTMKNCSDETIKGYESDLSLLFKFLKLHKSGRKIVSKDDVDDINIKDIDSEFINTITLNDLMCFMIYLKDKRNNSEYARTRKTYSIKSYFHYIYKKAKIIPEDIAEELESPKLPKREPISLTLEQSKKLLNSVDEGSEYYYRNRCILTLFLHCGIRLSELVNIKLSDINWEANSIKILGKGNKERNIYFDKTTLPVVKEYLETRIDECEYLFIQP
jgi:site-specific recombinase XerD